MITIENLCKAYNDKILFKNFHLEIPDSRFLVISGESGCGKSTLLNMIGGIETPDKGSIIVNGFDVAKKGKKQKYFKEVKALGISCTSSKMISVLSGFISLP